MLGQEPLDSEIPIEYADLPVELQQAVDFYTVLKDDWDFMNGNYLGKSLIGIKDLFELCNIEKDLQLFTLQIVNMLDSFRHEEYASRKKQT